MSREVRRAVTPLAGGCLFLLKPWALQEVGLGAVGRS